MPKTSKLSDYKVSHPIGIVGSLFERTAALRFSVGTLTATAANGTNSPLSAYRTRLHVPEAYSTAQPSSLRAASPFLGVDC